MSTEDFLTTTLPRALEATKLGSLSSLGRIIRDGSSPRLAVLMPANAHAEARRWLGDLADAARLYDPPFESELRDLAATRSFGLAFDARSLTTGGSVVALLLRTAPTTLGDVALATSHTRFAARPNSERTILSCTVHVTTAWMIPQLRGNGFSRLLAQALGEAVAHGVERSLKDLKAVSDITPSGIYVRLSAPTRDAAGAAYVDSCADEIRCACATNGRKIALDLR
jgi:hypothetical protein